MTGYQSFGLEQLLMAVGAAAAIVAALAALLLYQRWKNRRYLMAKIRREWGTEPERQYDPTEFDCISHYYLNRETEEFQIDDITWNDLDMDRVFMQMNHTRSFIGESYLYYLLRTPHQSNEKLEEFEQLIGWLETHEKQREELEYFFAKIGRTGRSSVFDYIYNLASAYCESSLVHFATTSLLVFSVLVLLVKPQPGILLLLASIGICMWTYDRCKRRVEPYIVSCAALEKVLQFSEQIVRYDVALLKKEKIKESVRSFGKLRRNMFFLVAGDAKTDGILQMLIAYLNSLFHIDLIQFKTVVREIGKHLPEFEFLTEEIGRVEAAIAVSSYRRLHPEYTVPVLHEDGPLQFKVQDMYHPLITEPVRNSLDTERCVLVTGSNASGKSTFLKTASLQAILAQTIHTVLASSYEARFFRVFSSMALRDDLVGEESYYMVEIRSLKRILDRIEGGTPVFCCVDEVLRGTNTVERIAASSQILKYIAEKGVLCMAATHDIELTYLLEAIYRNCHFEEEVTNEAVTFDYRLREGRAMTRNAIRLLGLMGFEEPIIRDAEALAEQIGEQPSFYANGRIQM